MLQDIERRSGTWTDLDNVPLHLVVNLLRPVVESTFPVHISSAGLCCFCWVRRNEEAAVGPSNTDSCIPNTSRHRVFHPRSMFLTLLAGTLAVLAVGTGRSSGGMIGVCFTGSVAILLFSTARQDVSSAFRAGRSNNRHLMFFRPHGYHLRLGAHPHHPPQFITQTLDSVAGRNPPLHIL